MKVAFYLKWRPFLLTMQPQAPHAQIRLSQEFNLLENMQAKPVLFIKNIDDNTFVIWCDILTKVNPVTQSKDRCRTNVLEFKLFAPFRDMKVFKAKRSTLFLKVCSECFFGGVRGRKRDRKIERRTKERKIEERKKQRKKER